MPHPPHHHPDDPHYAQLDAWIDQHFDEQVEFLQALVQVPTDTPPGNNAPHAERTAALLQAFGYTAEKHVVPTADVQAYGLQSITNLIVRRHFGAQHGNTDMGHAAIDKTEAGKVGLTIALNAHGDVVPPGDGWTHAPYGGDIVDGQLYGRASAVSKSDFATFTFATRALEALAESAFANTPSQPSSAQSHTALPLLRGSVELHFTYDEEFGGLLGPAWLLEQGLTKPDLMIAAGFSYEVVTAHNGCLQMEVTVQGEMAHAAIPDSGTDALQGAVHILQALYALNADYLDIQSGVAGIRHPYLNVGKIEGGTNTNVVPGQVVFKLDRRMIPEENPAQVEAHIRQTIDDAAARFKPPRGGQKLQITVRRLLLAHAMQPLAGNQPLVAALQRHGQTVFGQPIPAVGTPLYTDVRLYAAHGIPGVIYGAGPRTVRESHAKRADERLNLEDLRRATKVVARSLLDLLS